MNVKLLRRVAKYILAEPKRFDMDHVAIEVALDDKDAPPCGTVGCIAGWASVCGMKVIPTTAKDLIPLMGWETGQRELGLTHVEAKRLFEEPWCVYGPRKRDDGEPGWPVRYAKAYLAAKDAAGRARVAARRIEHFIKTRGRE